MQEERGESWRREKSAGQERRVWEESAEKERIVQDKFILIVKLRSRSIPYHNSKNLKESLRISENDSLLDQEHKL